MLKTETKQIGEYEYKVTQLDAITGKRAALRFARAVGPALAAIAEGKSEAAAVVSLTSSMTEEDLDYFCDIFAKSTSVVLANGKEPQLAPIFGVHFAGNYRAMMEWLLFCAVVNFGNFLGASQSDADA